MNSVALIGHLTKDIDLKVKGETKYARFTIGVSRDKDTSDFVPCVAFNKTAEVLQKYCTKGSKVALLGSVQTSSYKDEAGVQKYSTVIHVDRVELLGAKPTTTTQPEANGSYAVCEEMLRGKAAPVQEVIDSDDVPF